MKYDFTYCKDKMKILNWLTTNQHLKVISINQQFDDEWIIFYESETQPEEPVFTLQDLLDYGKYVAQVFSDNSPIDIAKYLKEKHNITIP